MTYLCDACDHPEDYHQPDFGCWEPECECPDYEGPDEADA